MELFCLGDQVLEYRTKTRKKPRKLQKFRERARARVCGDDHCLRLGANFALVKPIGCLFMLAIPFLAFC